MKSLLEFKSIVEEEKSDYSKFDTLVRAGLANKAQMQRIHKILDKMGEDKPQFNNADRMIIQNLFNKMVDLISNNKSINMQARRAVKEDEDFIEAEQLDEANPGPTPPYVLLLKRKAIRLYPDGTKIALYYNKQINKFFSVPYDTPTGTAIQAEAVVIKTNKPIGFRISDIGAGGKEYNVKTDKTYDDAQAKKKLPQGVDFAAQRRKERLASNGRMDEEGIMDKIKAVKRGMDAKAKAADHFDKAGDPTNPNKSKDLKRAVKYHNLVNKEEVEITEAVMDQLHKIVNDKSAQSVKFASGHTRKIDHFTASALTQVHKALNDDNKKKFADLVHKSPEHFMKASDFAFKHAK